MLSISSVQGVAALWAVLFLTISPVHSAQVSSKKISKAAPVEIKHKKSRRIALNSNNYLVPPPPAYVPAWLPESLYNASSHMQQVKSQPASNPYSKYIYTAPGHDSVTPVQQPNKYVTYWSKT